ncbi:MAG: hypothetical protein LBG29_01925 [Synergistaceae bacterium]|nr:hypothetical protein [Synergistaceae bacterium]
MSGPIRVTSRLVRFTLGRDPAPCTLFKWNGVKGTASPCGFGQHTRF